MAASISPLYWKHHHAIPRYSNPTKTLRLRHSSFPTNSYPPRHLLLLDSSLPQQHERQQHPLTAATRRRDAILTVALEAFTFPTFLSNALAETDNFRTYIDDVNKFQISIPQDWQVGTGEPNGFKSVTAFYPEEASTSNVSVVITGLGPDFTRMESFGKVEEFAETLVGGLDRSWQRPPGVAAKLVDCKASKGLYYIEYTLQNPGETRRHLFSALGMASNGWYNRLYTVTGQFADEETEKYGSQVPQVVSSFKFI